MSAYSNYVNPVSKSVTVFQSTTVDFQKALLNYIFCQLLFKIHNHVFIIGQSKFKHGSRFGRLDTIMTSMLAV